MTFEVQIVQHLQVVNNLETVIQWCPDNIAVGEHVKKKYKKERTKRNLGHFYRLDEVLLKHIHQGNYYRRQSLSKPSTLNYKQSRSIKDMHKYTNTLYPSLKKNARSSESQMHFEVKRKHLFFSSIFVQNNITCTCIYQPMALHLFKGLRFENLSFWRVQRYHVKTV